MAEFIKKSPLALKTFVACISLALVASIVSSSMMYWGARKALLHSLSESAMAEASNASTQIDPVLLYCIRSNAGNGTPEYVAIRNLFSSIRINNPDIRTISVVRKTATPGKYILLTQSGGYDLHTSEVTDAQPGPHKLGMLTKPTTDSEPRRDSQGVWFTAYAPIQNALGDAEATIAIETSAKNVYLTESRLKRTAARTTVVVVLLASLLSLLMTRAMVWTLRIFTQAADRVRKGDLDFQVSYCGSAETERFRDVFNGMISDLKESRDRLLELATQDVQTGLFNHMYFQERLGVEVERADRYDRPLCLMLLDVDRFKCMNDNLGHPTGDSILRQLADFIRANTRAIDIVARYGGDELAIILPETDNESGLADAERVRACIERHEFHAVPISELHADDFVPERKNVVHITVTIGVSSYPDNHETRDGLVMAGDIALCRAKHVARNSVCAYESLSCGEDHIDPHALYQVLQDPNAAAIQSLAAAVDAKDRYTCGHSERVAAYAIEIGKALDVPPEMQTSLNIAGLLHDLGKIGVPDSVLNKPGSLTAEERETIKRHSSVGGNILRRAPQLDVIIPAVIYHHERWDGKGYPDGLVGEAIPLIARIMGVADAFDAMTSERPYRKAMSVDAALMELTVGAGKQFDPAVVEAFVNHIGSQTHRMAA